MGSASSPRWPRCWRPSFESPITGLLRWSASQEAPPIVVWRRPMPVSSAPLRSAGLWFLLTLSALGLGGASCTGGPVEDTMINSAPASGMDMADMTSEPVNSNRRPEFDSDPVPSGDMGSQEDMPAVEPGEDVVFPEDFRSPDLAGSESPSGGSDEEGGVFGSTHCLNPRERHVTFTFEEGRSARAPGAPTSSCSWRPEAPIARLAGTRPRTTVFGDSPQRLERGSGLAARHWPGANTT